MKAPAPFVPACLLALVALSPLQAAPINITLDPAPDIASGFITVNYNAGTKAFTAVGTALSINDDNVGPSHAIVGGSFNLSATIDNAGVLSPGGTVSITGTVAALGFNSGTLLTGNLTALGFPNTGGDPLEFLFTPTGGDAQSLYKGTGGIILTQTGFPTTLFTQTFNNVVPGLGFGLGLADTGVVATVIPEPATLAIGIGLVLSGLGVRTLRRRRTGATPDAGSCASA